MKRVLLAMLAVGLIISLAVSLCSAERIMRVGDRQIIDFSRMIAELRGTRLVFIGEEHDRMMDHWRQAKIIKALDGAGPPLAIGLEMFTAESQEALDRWVAGKIGEEEFINIYTRNWDIPWSYYRDIFYYARRHGIPLVALNVPREVVHKVAREGFAALAPDERKKLPTGVTCNVDTAYMEMVRRAFAAHSGNHDLFVHFCEAQMLWNKGMAKRLVEYVRMHPGVSVIVLAGTGHAMKPGIPREALDEAGIESKVILREDKVFSRDTVTEADADYLIEK